MSKQKSLKAFGDALYALKEERDFLQAVHAKGMHEMLYISASSYLAAFRETKETGDDYAAYRERFRRTKEIVPVAYSLKSLKSVVGSCAYTLNLPCIFHIWHKLKKHYKSGVTLNREPMQAAWLAGGNGTGAYLCW